MYEDFMNGAKSSLSESVEWIGFYMMLFGALLLARTFIIPADLGRLPVFVAAASFCVGAALVSQKEVRHKGLIAGTIIFLQLSALVSGEHSPFKIFDVFVWPAATWILAVAITALFAMLGRLPPFNDDLLPLVSYGWTTFLNRLGGFVLMMTAISLLTFFPSYSSFSQIDSWLPQRTGHAIAPDEFKEVMRILTGDLIHKPGIWNAPIPVVGNAKDGFALLVVAIVLLTVLARTTYQIRSRNVGVTKYPIPKALDETDGNSGEKELTGKLAFLFTFAASAFLFGIFAPVIAAEDKPVSTMLTCSGLAILDTSKGRL